MVFRLLNRAASNAAVNLLDRHQFRAVQRAGHADREGGAVAQRS